MIKTDGSKSVDQQAELNKKNVMSFYELMFNQCKPAEAVAKYVGDVYIQHNPVVKDGKTAFIECGKIVEHWDVLQRVPKESANQNSMF